MEIVLVFFVGMVFGMYLTTQLEKDIDKRIK